MNGKTDSTKVVGRVDLAPMQKVKIEAQRWKDREVKPNALAFLREHADVRDDPTLVLELAYEEFYLRTDRGEKLDVNQFCQQFSLVRRSLQRRLEVDQFLRNETPELFKESFRWPKVGDPLLDFLVVSPLATGGFSRVYLCAEKDVGDRQVVVKVARRGAFEAAKMGRLGHPNVMPILSVRTDERTGTSCLSMPFVGRSTLRHLVEIAFRHSVPRFASVILDASTCSMKTTDRLQQLAPPLQINPKSSYTQGVLQLAIQIASALQHAHGQGVIHGDLKPSNVVMTWLGTPLLVDFNLACDADKQVTVVAGGTVPYMAPEKLRARILGSFERDTIDTRADVFSFGVTIYELLTGQLPFELSNAREHTAGVVEMLRQQAKGVRLVKPLNSIANRELVDLLKRCMAFDPGNRPQSMDEVVSLLDGELAVHRRLFRSLCDRRLTVVSIAASGCAGIAAMFWTRGQWSSVRNQHYRAGRRLFHEKKFVASIESFGKAIRNDNQFHQAHFARACAALYGRLERQTFISLDAIESDLKASGMLEFDPRILVGHGMICLAHSDFLNAANALENAIKHGVQSPVVWNNLGYACLKVFVAGDEYDVFLRRADAALRRAIAMDDTLLSAHYNFSVCALAAYRSLDDPKMPILGLKSIRKVVAVERCAVPYICAAKLAGIVAEQTNDDQLWGDCITFLECASNQGMDVRKYLDSHPFSSQREHSRVLALADRPPREMAVTAPDRIVFPRKILTPDVI